MRKIFKSFSFAFQGIAYTFKTQNNFKIHVLAGILAIVFSFFIEISSFEWIVMIMCIALVLFAELVNTAIESIVDLVSPEYHLFAKIAKDTAAASVLVLALMSLVVAFIIFSKYIL